MPAIRQGKTSRFASLEEALEAIRPALDSGRIWLRGQVHPWRPASSMSRLELSGATEALHQAEARLAHFLAWVESQEDVHTDLDTTAKAMAAAQHYGLATNLLDFTLSLEVAAFFASDTESPPPGDLACIYLLDTAELARCWRRELRDAAPALQIYPVLDRVANLWRLETQSGLFLHAPGRWWEWFEMDCVTFPRPAPQEELRGAVYPRERSRLEDRLDRFFLRERMRMAAEEREREIGRRPRCGSTSG